ncbi:MAG TPA: PAS domain S-box protein [Verrucomicrobiae bacterium]|nr:PAS domain S-box protein [Verrucomicrobiae bacterium]
MNLKEFPIRRKIMAAIMMTSITVVILTVAAFMIYDLTTIRTNTIRDFGTLARVIAANSSAALAFKNDTDAHDVLYSLAAEPQVLSAALYDESGKLFQVYPAGVNTNSFPVHPMNQGYRLTREHIELYEPVEQRDVWHGTLFLQVDLQFFYSRLELYAIISLLIVMGSITVALALSSRLQKNVSDPILALADSARSVSERGDYSVRAVKTSNDEIGLLTDAFNQMLTRIQEQTVALQESENRLRLALEASSTGTWDWNVSNNQVIWDERNVALFGLKPGEFRGTFEHFLELIQPENREPVRQAIDHALENKTEFTIEFCVLWPDGSSHEMVTRGRAFYDSDGKAVRMSGVSQDITERKDAEEASRRLAAIVESTDDAIIGKSLDGIVMSWNKSAERIFGYSAREIVGESILRITAPGEFEFEKRVLAAVKRGETRTYETQRIQKSGQPVDVSLTVSPVRNADGQIVGASSISRDITERKRGERELQESRARLSGIITSAMDAIISVDGEQKVTLFNAAAERMFRCTRTQAIGKPLNDFIPERFRAELQDDLKQFGKAGASARASRGLHPLAGLRADGEEFPVEASISHIEVNGQPIFTVILRDITERMEAQRAREHQARVLREQAQMLDLANVMARDLEGRIILWNTGMEKIYGWKRSETLGHSSHEVLKTKSQIPLSEIGAIVRRQGHWEGELVHMRKDGKPITVNSQWVLHTDHQGNPIAILEVNTDITERKQAEQEIMRMNTELEQRVNERTIELMAANQELEAFTYSVAHDLRAPLRHIDAFTKIIFDDFAEQIPEEAQRYLQNIRKGSQNMNQLVDDLLNLARVGRQELKREITSLNPLVDEVIADLRRDTEKREIEWRIDALPTVQCDPGLIKQVFVNLLSNAVKYTRPRTKAVIEVGHQYVDEELVFFVRDNGVGFNMKYSNKLFGVFQRLHRADEFEGTGVGLATVDRIIRKHGGRIWAESELDKSTTFYFTLDRARKPQV